MSNRALLGGNKDVVSRQMLGDTDLFAPESIVKAKNFVRQYIDVRPSVTDTVYGTTFEFLIPRVASVLGAMIIYMVHSAATSTAASAGYPRRVDSFATASVTRVSISWGSNTLQNLSGDAIKQINSINRSTDDQWGDLVYEGLQDNPAQRATDAASALTTYLPIPYFGSQSMANHIVIDSDVLREDLRVSITTTDKNLLFETDGSDIGATITSIYLRCEMFHLEPEHVAKMKGETMGMNAELGIPGRVRLCTTYVETSFPVLNSTDYASYSLSTIRYLAREIMHHHIKDSDNPSTLSSNRNRWNCQQVLKWNINMLNQDIAPDLDHKFSKHYLMNKFHSADPSLNIYSWPWSYAPQILTAAVGHMDMNYIGASFLKMQPLASWATTGRLYVLVPVINIFAQTKQGECRMLFIT